MLEMHNTTGGIWHFRCPYCFRENSYKSERDSPFYCIACNEELPEYSSIVNMVDERKDYYEFPSIWLYGPNKENK